jgi:hypothetical protein
MKPKIYVYDWKNEAEYIPIKDVVDLKISDELPKSADDIDAIILHLSTPFQLGPLLKELVKKKVPVIFNEYTDTGIFGINFQLESMGLKDEKNIYIIPYYNDVFKKIHELFDTKR